MYTPFSTLSFTNRQWNDVVFENRNKAYGAYYIRTHYNENVGAAFLIAMIFLLSLFASISLYLNLSSITVVAANKPTKKTDTVFVAPPRVIIEPLTQVHPAARRPLANSNLIPAIRPDTVVHRTDTMPVVSTTPTAGTSTGTTTTTSGPAETVTTGAPLATVPALAPDTAIWVADVMPEFPGGEAALDKYILNHVNIPRQWKDEGDEGKIYFGFVVGKDGSVRDVQILRDDVHYGCAESNTGLFLKMPKWKPGKQHGNVVNVRMQLPLIFKKGME